MAALYKEGDIIVTDSNTPSASYQRLIIEVCPRDYKYMLMYGKYSVDYYEYDHKWVEHCNEFYTDFFQE